jgi:hypothetical protein
MANLREELKRAINHCSAENGSNTPDFILAEYLTDCLAAFEKASTTREKWYGHFHAPGEDLPLVEVATQPPAPPQPAGDAGEPLVESAEVDERFGSPIVFVTTGGHPGVEALHCRTSAQAEEITRVLSGARMPGKG